MKTSPSTSLAVFVTLAMGGAFGGSLFSASLQEDGYGSIGTAGTFFTDVKIKESAQPVQVMATAPESYRKQDVATIPVKVKSDKLAPPAEVRAVVSLPITEPDPEPTDEPETADESNPISDSIDGPLISPESDAVNLPVLAPELNGESLESPVESELNADIPLIVLG